MKEYVGIQQPGKGDDRVAGLTFIFPAEMPLSSPELSFRKRNPSATIPAYFPCLYRATNTIDVSLIAW